MQRKKHFFGNNQIHRKNCISVLLSKNEKLSKILVMRLCFYIKPVSQTTLLNATGQNCSSCPSSYIRPIAKEFSKILAAFTQLGNGRECIHCFWSHIFCPSLSYIYL